MLEQKIILDGEEIIYFATNKEVHRPVPRFFVLEESKKFYLSEEIPKNFRPFILWREKMKKQKPSYDSLTLTISELKQVGKNLTETEFNQYLDFRKELSANLINYLEKYYLCSSELLQEKDSLDFLKSITDKLI